MGVWELIAWPVCDDYCAIYCVLITLVSVGLIGSKSNWGLSVCFINWIRYA